MALARVAQAPPHGYTIVQVNSGTNTAVYLFTPDVKFAPSDFAGIGMFNKIAGDGCDLAHLSGGESRAIPSSYAKFRTPASLNIGHSGAGSQNYLFCKAFVQAAGIDVTLVGYRGGGPALNDLIGGQIDGICDSSASVTPAIQSGLIRAIAFGIQNAPVASA